MIKFKKGERVILINNLGMRAPVGSPAIVIKDGYEGDDCLLVRWDCNTSQMSGGYDFDKFKSAKITNWKQRIR